MTQGNSPSAPTQPPPGAPPVDYATPVAAMKRAYTGPSPTKDDTNMAMLTYILAILTGFLGPLILWLIKRNDSPFVDDQGKEVLNYQITTILAILACIPLMFVLIGFLLYPVVIICYLVFMIMGAVKASRGEAYRFPVSLRLLK